jgi:hypothetical protein
LEDDGIDILEALEEVAQPTATQKGKRPSSSSKPNTSKTTKGTKTPNTDTVTLQMVEVPASTSTPNDNDTQVLSSFPSTVDLATSVSPSDPTTLIHASHHVLQSKLQAAAVARGSSSIHSPISVFIENTSINNLMEAMDDGSIMAKMHTFVEKVHFLLH